LIFIQAVDDDNKWGVFEVESSRTKVTKRFSDELSELSVDGLMENIWVNIHSGFNTCKRVAGSDRGWWRQIE